MIKIIKRKNVKCPYCGSLKTIKKGVRKDVKNPITRYFCKDCKRKFQSKHRVSKKQIQEEIFKKFFWKKRTLDDLKGIYGFSISKIEEIINNYEVEIKRKIPRKVGLVVDVVFFDKRKFGTEFGIMIFYDAIQQEPLIWKEVKRETLSDYMELYFKLKEQGFTFKYVVIDGKTGLKRFFVKENLLVQHCQFHQLQTITRYISRKPRLKTSKMLKDILKDFTKYTDKEFKEYLEFIEIWNEKEITETIFNPSTKKEEVLHKKLNSALRSLKTNLPYLFTYKKYPELNIPNTTNILDGGEFSYLKRLLRNHNGFSKKLKLKLIDEYFENHPKKMKRKKK